MHFPSIIHVNTFTKQNFCVMQFETFSSEKPWFAKPRLESG